MKRLILSLPLLFCLAAAWAQDVPPCARLDSSALRFPGGREPMERFAAKLAACRENPDSVSVTIWHIGGSHVQAGWFPSRLRHNFDSLGRYRPAGRGYIFPYPLAHTNFDKSFVVGGEGEWMGSISANPNRKMPVSPEFGIMGVAAYTVDTTAAFGLRLPREFTRLHVMGDASPEVVPIAIAGADTLAFMPDSLLHGFVADFPAAVDSVRIEPRLKDGESFTVTGLLPEIEGDTGLRYVSTGANGARTTTWMARCPQFVQELSLVHPDLVVLGLGINDSSCPAKDFKPEKFKANYRKLIETIQEQTPDCALLFITNNDSWRWSRRRMVHNDNGVAVARAMYELAEEYDAAVWDLFEIMGGNGSATEWREAGLMKKDRLHFTREGYELLGDLLYKAIEEVCEVQ